MRRTLALHTQVAKICLRRKRFGPEPSFIARDNFAHHSMTPQMKWVASAAIVLVAAGIFGVPRMLATRSNPTDGEFMKFDAAAWSTGPGPRRIAMARQLVKTQQLRGHDLAAAESLLGPRQPCCGGQLGWFLGIPAASPSLYPNHKWLCTTLDGQGKISSVKVVDND